MLLESILAYAHLLAILTMVVFISSEAALCRPEWLNAAAVQRLARIDMVYRIAAVAVLLTGIARVVWGIKGGPFYATNWLLHLKFALFIVVALLSIRPTLAIRGWAKALHAGGALPGAAAVQKTRKRIMVQAHLIALIPLAAVFLARGFGAK